jgi:sugar-specific transcriptional regulator TrmB
MYENALKDLGLSEHEVRVYVALLELGTSKVEPVSKRVNLPRTTVYGILSSLLEKGLVSYVIKSGVKYYEATSPERLLLREKERVEELKKVIPELAALENTIGEKPSMEMYEGKEGIKTIYEDMLKTRQTIYGYGNTKLLFELLEFYIPNYISRRAKLGISFKVVTEKSKIATDMQKKDKKERRETRFIKEMENITSVTYLYGDKIAIMGLIKKQPIGIIIQNESFYNSQKLVFDILWKIAKK